MASHRALHVACYDIACPRRLRAALWQVRRYASGGQKSVHECWLTPAEHGYLLGAYALLMDERYDRILLARIDPHRAPMIRGAGRMPTDDTFLLVA
jgi:CRISPR-associated protein Cas2